MTKKKQERMKMMMVLEMFSNYSITLGSSNHVLTKGTKLQNGFEIKTDLWDVLTYGEENQTMEELDDFIIGYFNEEKVDMNPESLAEFVCIINHKSWYHAGKNNKLASFYSDWYYEVHDWCMDNLKGKAKSLYYNIVD